MPINITIDGILHEVWADRVMWSNPRTCDAFEVAPEAFAEIARALVLCDFEDRGEHSYILGDMQLYEHFVDTHDDDNNEVPEGRDSWLHFPLKAGMSQMTRPTAVMTGKMGEQKIVSVLSWYDPLNEVVTAGEIEESHGVKAGTVKKAAQQGRIVARKSAGTWLFRNHDVIKKWS